MRPLTSRTLLLSIFCPVLGLLAACSSSTALTPDQAQTISPEARAYLNSHSAVRVPLIRLPVSLIQKIRKRPQKENDAAMEAYRQQHNLQVTREKIDGIPVVIITPPSTTLAAAPALGFYTHGGGFMFGSAYDYTCLTMAQELGIPVVSVEYRLAPEVPFPGALNDALAVYRQLVADYPTKKMVAFGESAGGNLTLATMLKARDAGVKLPVALGLFTPWADLTGAGDSHTANDGRDPVIGWHNQLDKGAKAYLGEASAQDPLTSPIHANYAKGFPPSIITTGTRDLFLSDCTRLYWVLRTAHVPVEFRIWEGMWHGPEASPTLPEGQEYRREVAAFLQGYLHATTAGGRVPVGVAP